MITPSQAFDILKQWLTDQADLVRTVCTDINQITASPFFMLEVPQLHDIRANNNIETSHQATYRLYIQIGTQNLSPWESTAVIHDIGSALRIRLNEETNKGFNGVFKDFDLVKFLGMPVVALGDKNDSVLMVIGRLGIEFEIEEHVELSGVLVDEIHNHYDNWEKELLHEETYDASDVTSN
jgi:hypothetical protein